MKYSPKRELKRFLDEDVAKGDITSKLLKKQKIVARIITREETVVDTSAMESAIAVLEEKVQKLENADTAHSHEVGKHDHDTSHEHDNTAVKIVEKEIELLKVQIEEIKVKSSNPLAN